MVCALMPENFFYPFWINLVKQKFTKATLNKLATKPSLNTRTLVLIQHLRNKGQDLQCHSCHASPSYTFQISDFFQACPLAIRLPTSNSLWRTCTTNPTLIKCPNAYQVHAWVLGPAPVLLLQCLPHLAVGGCSTIFSQSY